MSPLRNEHGAPSRLVAECGASKRGLERCYDTDDTNRGPGDTRTIRWVVKMVRSKTFPMSVDRPLERRLQTVAGAIDFLLTDGSRNHGHAP